MKWHWAILLSAAAMLGCRSTQPATNPFMRTTVPPPGTGQGAVVVQGEQYYPGASPQAVPQAMPQTMAPPASMSPPVMSTQPTAPLNPALPGNNRFSPPGGSFQYNQSKVITPPNLDEDDEPDLGDIAWADDTRRKPPRANEVAAARPIERASREPESLTTEQLSPEAVSPEPDAVLKVSFGDSAEPRQTARYEVSRRHDEFEEVLDAEPHQPRVTRDGFGELPESSVRIVSSPPERGPADQDDAIPNAAPVLRVTADDRQAVAVSTVSWDKAQRRGDANPRASQVRMASGAADSEFAFANDYTALRGRLEYSQSLRQWKLRYIPIDGQTDAYGGSVVLPNSPELESYKAGQLVAVRGELASRTAPSGTFSPSYRLDTIEPISR